jgi:hypothetical protein
MFHICSFAKERAGRDAREAREPASSKAPEIE